MTTTDDLFSFIPKARPGEYAQDHEMSYEPQQQQQEEEPSMDAFTEEVEQQILAEGTEADASTSTAAALSLSHEVRHEVAIPADYPYVPLHKHVYLDPPAKTYPFTLDPFQKLAVGCIERNESVLVSAHTSAGKTVVAEYAIATSLRDKQRVIYTSPIKALSNQKYRELQETFGDVGLMTGDVTINPEASCLVMTTEILRSMLYRGSEVMREVAWVVFDEIHYMRDKERGVVWEETLILLPDNVHYVFLSATIPNAKQFARWVCQNHRQPCHVVYTNYRPTPLQHYLFPASGDGIYLVVDEKSVFREDNFQKALNIFGDAGAGGGMDVLGDSSAKRKRPRPRKGGAQGAGQQSDLYKMIKMIMAKNYQPVIVFSFSKRECESNAMQVSKLDFNLEEEKKLVASVFENALESLKEEDRNLPQIEGILPLLKRGIGVHHSGLLPILKEVIEILFQEGLLKVLFATETFSIGLNMPARTVVFTSVRKFDGKEYRWVSGGEYIQMSGRAGRRGLDARGIVILMVEEKMEPLVAKNMLKGNSDALNSAFHLSYNMILNLMRVEGLTPEYMLERSFYQFQNADSIPGLAAQLERLQAEHDEMYVEEEPLISSYHLIRSQLEALREDFRKVVHHPAYSLPFMQPGRLVRVKDGASDYGWCVVVHLQKRAAPSRPAAGNKDSKEAAVTYILDVLAFCKKPDSPVDAGVPQPCPAGEKGEMIVLPVSLTVLDGISSVRIHLPADLKPYDHRATVFKTVCEVERRFPDGLPLLDPFEDMGIKDPAFRALLEKVEKLELAMRGHALHKDARLPRLLKGYMEKVALQDRANALRRHIKEAKSILQMEELKARKRVLRRLGFTTAAANSAGETEDLYDNDTIEMKGRVACEISTGDELLLTEMMFAGVFNALTPEQTVALLSCFIFEEKSSDDSQPRLKEELAAPLRTMQETARRIAKVSAECKLLEPGEQEYVDSFRPELMDVVYAWCQGAKFARICKMTDVFEGSIIRCLRRLEELLRQMAQAARSIGNTELEQKFEEGIAKMKRDIVFANSLYL